MLLQHLIRILTLTPIIASVVYDEGRSGHPLGLLTPGCLLANSDCFGDGKIQELEAINTFDDCRDECYNQQGCQWLSWNHVDKLCRLHEHCYNRRSQNDEESKNTKFWVSGPKKCPELGLGCYHDNLAISDKNNLKLGHSYETDSYECQRKCYLAGKSCKFYTLDKRNGKCKLFADNKGWKTSRNHVSGSKHCYNEFFFIRNMEAVGNKSTKIYITSDDSPLTCLKMCQEEPNDNCWAYQHQLVKGSKPNKCHIMFAPNGYSAFKPSSFRTSGTVLSGIITHVNVNNHCFDYYLRFRGSEILKAFTWGNMAQCRDACTNEYDQCVYYTYDFWDSTCQLYENHALTKIEFSVRHVSGKVGHCNRNYQGNMPMPTMANPYSGVTEATCSAPGTKGMMITFLLLFSSTSIIRMMQIQANFLRL